MIHLKSDEEIRAMRPAGKLAAEVLGMIEPFVKPGVSTEDLNKRCHDFIVSRGGIPAPLNYKGFPKSICSSINDVVCHGIPSKEALLADGDIINIDITAIVDGYHGDTSRTFFVGDVKDSAKKLVDATQESLKRAIAIVKIGTRLGDIGHTIQSFVEPLGYSVVRDFVGHGIGKNFHEDPQVLHYGKAGTGKRIQAGMVFTIEPMINEGSHHCEILEDGWTALTKDGKLSAQFEHTIGVYSNGEVEILTSL